MKPRALTIVCATYIAFVLYGSLMPFDLAADWSEAQGHLDRAWEFWPFGDRLHTSRADLASNFALYVPLGLLVAARGPGAPGLARGGRRFAALLAAVLAAMGTSIIVEVVQLFSASRVSGAHDVLMNTAGGLAGAMLGVALGRPAWVRLRRWLRLRLARNPLSLVGLLLLLLLAGDALFPFRATLDVSEMLKSVRGSGIPLETGMTVRLLFEGVLRSAPEGMAAHPWHHWAVRRIGVYAVLAVLLGVWAGNHSRPRWLRGAAIAAGFSVAAELSKIFIVSRTPSVANVLMSACGAVVGGLLGMALTGRLSARAKITLAFVILMGYVVYVAWEPFSFRWDPGAAAAKIPTGAAWLPLYHYAIRGRPDDVHLFVRTLVLLSALAYTVRLRGGWLGRGGHWSRAGKAALLAGAAGLMLELGQFLIPGRVPSVTDVFCFALGGVIGGTLAVAGSPGRRAEVEHR